jgi:threonine dehydratase
VQHERNSSHTQINGCTLRVEMETRNLQHIADIKKALRENGFDVKQ